MPTDSSANGLTRAGASAVATLAKAGVLAYTDTATPTAAPVAARWSPLVYRATDDSFWAAVTLTVAAGARTLATIAVPMQRVAPGTLYRAS